MNNEKISAVDVVNPDFANRYFLRGHTDNSDTSDTVAASGRGAATDDDANGQRRSASSYGKYRFQPWFRYNSRWN